MTLAHRITQQAERVEWDFFGTIENFNDYKQLISCLAQAGEQDCVVLKISSGGGDCEIGMAIVKAIINSKATTIAHVVWPSASMAAIIACACDGMVMDDYTYLMFHTYSSGAYGKSGDLLSQVKHDHWVLEENFKGLCQPFLSKKEFDRIQKGEDLYIRSNDPDIKTRIKRHFKITVE